MTRRRDFKRLVRARMTETGENYTAARRDVERPEPAVETAPVEGRPVEGTSIPILPARHIPETLALFERLGFAVRHDEANDYAMVRRGAIELHLTASPDLDPWTSAGMAFVRLDDVAALYEEFVATAVLPLVPGPRSELQPAERRRDELRARWDNGESIARMGELADKAWGIREFALLDPNNNLIRFGQALG